MLSHGVRGRGRRGRGASRGSVGRGGSNKSTSIPNPTTIVNGIAVPKFGPGAWEAIKAAKKAGANVEGT